MTSLHHHVSAISFLGCLLLGACTEPAKVPQGFTTPPSDAGQPDTTTPDDGPLDAAGPDAGLPVDATLSEDATRNDQGPSPMDQGVDAEAPDLGPARPDGPIRGSYLNEIRLETAEGTGADIDGDGDIDNRLGVLLETVRIFAPELDANVKLRAAISDGTLRIGARWNGLDEAQLLDGDRFEVGMIDFEPGEGYTPQSRSVHPDGTPRALFTDVSIEGGILRAGAREMQLIFTVWGIPVTLDVAHVQLTGMVLPFIDGIGVRDGRITGGVTIDSIGRFLNDFMAEPECDCLELDGPFIDLSRGVADACHPDLDHTRCGPEDQTSCAVLAERCEVVVPMFTNGADVDSDGDGEMDALGVDLRMNALGVALDP